MVPECLWYTNGGFHVLLDNRNQYGDMPSPALSSLQPSYITRLTTDWITHVIMETRDVAHRFAIYNCLIFGRNEKNGKIKKVFLNREKTSLNWSHNGSMNYTVDSLSRNRSQRPLTNCHTAETARKWWRKDNPWPRDFPDIYSIKWFEDVTNAGTPLNPLHSIKE